MTPGKKKTTELTLPADISFSIRSDLFLLIPAGPWGVTDLWIRGSPESHEHQSPSWSSCWKHQWGAVEDKTWASTAQLVCHPCLIIETPCLSGAHPCPPVALRGLAPRLDSSGPAGRCFHPPRVRGSLLLAHRCNPGRVVLGWLIIYISLITWATTFVLI